MSDLHCPATLLVARHGEAAYEHPEVTADDGGWLTPLGREQVAALARSLAGRRIAAVYSSTLQRAVESATIAAAALGVRASAVDGLQEVRVGDLAGRPSEEPVLDEFFASWFTGRLELRVPGAESGAEVVGRYREALQGIADQHRGETVLVISHGGVMALSLPRLARNTRDDLAAGGALANCALAELEIGDSGIELLQWPDDTSRPGLPPS